jgi:hypothetical protein
MYIYGQTDRKKVRDGEGWKCGWSSESLGRPCPDANLTQENLEMPGKNNICTQAVCLTVSNNTRPKAILKLVKKLDKDF